MRAISWGDSSNWLDYIFQHDAWPSFVRSLVLRLALLRGKGAVSTGRCESTESSMPPDGTIRSERNGVDGVAGDGTTEGPDAPTEQARYEVRAWWEADGTTEGPDVPI